MSRRPSRPLSSVLALAACAALAAPAFASEGDAQIYDAVNGFEIASGNNPPLHHGFIVTGIKRGESAEQSTPYQFPDPDTGDRYVASCERYAMIAMKDAGHYAFVVVTYPGSGTPLTIEGCRLERR